MGVQNEVGGTEPMKMGTRPLTLDDPGVDLAYRWLREHVEMSEVDREMLDLLYIAVCATRRIG